MSEIFSSFILLILVAINYLWIYLLLGLWLSGALPKTRGYQDGLKIFIFTVAVFFTYLGVSDRRDRTEYSDQCRPTYYGEECY